MTLKKLLLVLLAIQASRANFNFSISGAEDVCSKKGSVGNLLKVLMEQLNEVEYGIKDVGIFQLTETDKSSGINGLLDGIHHCIPQENPILRFSELSGKFVNQQEKSREYKRKRVAVTIIISDQQDSIKLYNKIEKYSNEDYWGKNSKTILISTTNMTNSDFQELSEKIYYLGILDLVMMHADQNNFILGYNKFQEKTFKTQSRDLARIFPNKLTNLHGYSYKLFFLENPVETISVKGELHNGQLYMLQELVKHQNARSHFEKFFPKTQLDESYNDSYVSLGRYDFGPNLRMRWTLEEPSYPMFTYFTTKFCALAPKKPKRTILSYMETPFDKITWIILLISFAIGALIWWIIQKSRFGKSSQSVTHFIFALYGMFFDQDTPMMGLSRSQRCLYQHFVVTLFLLGVLYQSLIVSLIFTNRNVQDLNTFDDLRAANIPVYGDENYVNSLNSSGSYTNFLKRLRIYEQFEASLFTKKNPVIFPCILKSSILKDNSFDLSNFYELKDSEFPNYYYYITWYQNPLIEKLKDHFARIFESGLQRLFREKYLKLREEINDNNKRKLVNQEVEDFYLEFDDLFGLYHILLYGSLLALLAFILEWIHYLVGKYGKMWVAKMRIMLIFPLKFMFFK